MDRTELAVSIQNRNAEKAQLSENQETLNRSSALVSSLAVCIEQHNANQVEQALHVATSLAEQLRQGVAATLEHHTPLGLSEKMETQSRLEIAKLVRDQLQQEVDLQSKIFKVSDNKVKEHAFNVMRLESESIAKLIEDYEGKLIELRTELRGLETAEYMLANVTGDIQWDKPRLLTSRAQQVMDRPQQPQFIGGVDPAGKRAIRWRNFFDKLTNDSTVELNSIE